MSDAGLSAQERRKRLGDELKRNPFLSDEQLALLLSVSIHTVRADRRKAGIPEVRKRGGDFSRGLFATAKTLSDQEIVGELLEIDLDHEGLSLLETTPESGLAKSGIVRGHVLFAQANTLANAIVDAEVALTGEAQVRFPAPLYAGERVLAKAQVISGQRHKKEVQVVIRTRDKLVFEGVFSIHCLNEKLAAHFRIEPKRRKRGAKR